MMDAPETFMPVLYVNDLKEPYTILEDGTVYKDIEDTHSFYFSMQTHWLKKTWLQYEKRPFMVWSGCKHRITPLDNLVPDDDFLKLLKEEGLVIFLYEPLTIYREDVANVFLDHQHYDQFESTELDIQMMRSYELDSITEFSKKYELEGSWVFSCDYNISKYFGKQYHMLNLRCQDIFIAGDATGKEIKQPYETKRIHKKFWCGNWRYTGVRHLIMMYLASTDSFYNGNYSWYVYGGRGHVNGKLWFDLENWEETNPEVAGKIEYGENRLNEVVPLSMDVTNPPMWFVGEGNSKKPPVLSTYQMPYHYSECFVAIVNESRFAQPTANFSEKVLNAMRAFRPFILVGPPKTLEYIKKMGFKTFNDFWDESYDQELNHEQRLLKIFKLIDTIDQMTLEECRRMLEQMKPILTYNAKFMHTLSRVGRDFR